MSKLSELFSQISDMAHNKDTDELTYGIESIMRILYPKANDIFIENVNQFALFTQGFLKTYKLILLDVKEYEQLYKKGGESNE